MKVLIDGQTLLTPEINRGIGKYFVKTVEQVLQYDFTNDFYLMTPGGPHLNVFSAWARAKLNLLTDDAYDSRIANDSNRQQRYSDALNNDIEKLAIDVYWSPNALMGNVVVPERQVSQCKYAVTIFDMIPAVMEKQYAKQWPASLLSTYRNGLKRLETVFDLYLHISRHTKSDFVRILDVKHKRHVVTALGVDPAFRPYAFPHAAGADYVIYPGGFDPRKNMERAVESFAQLHKRYAHDTSVTTTQLCIVCKADKASEARLLNYARKLGVDGKIFLTGFVDDRKLIELYQKARCLFFPSLYEGFGLPVLEGLACGLPVAASNTSSVPEVGGDLALYFDPLNVTDMAETLYQVLRAPMDHDSKLTRSEYASSFSWKKTGIATLNALINLKDDVREQEQPHEISINDPVRPTEFIDVRQRMKELSVEELCETAEAFFARLDDWAYLHAKPFASVNETPELLINFAHVVHGLNLLPDMTIMDFGAGSCWTSRFLSQLGLQVVAVDVSATALKIGEELYRRYPVIGDQPQPRFLQFDGRHINLPDESVDRISCWDAFHHVPNPNQVLKEMGRVLKTGGIAGFSEPGPEHSRSPQAQYEMRTNKLIENDINLEEIWVAAQAAGFTDIKMAIFSPKPLLRPLDQFEAYLSGADAGHDFVAETRDEMQHRRVFFLLKGESTAPQDSRQRAGLACDLQVRLTSNEILAGSSAVLRVTVTNVGTATWLPSTARVGGVRFGVHLFARSGELLDLDYFRQALPQQENQSTAPGDLVEFVAEVPMPSRGSYTLQCDLVSEGVCWFEHDGSPTVRLDVEVV